MSDKDLEILSVNPLSEDQRMLIENNIRLAFKFSKRFKPPCGMNYDEWQAECLCFLVDAVRRFNFGNTKFAEHAWISMRYGMYDYIRSIRSKKRDHRRTQQIDDYQESCMEDCKIKKKVKLNELREQLSNLIQRLPHPLWREIWFKRMDGKDLNEICKEVGVSRTKVKNAYKTGLISLQSMVERNNIECAI